jgi:hypothetical protein
MPKFFLYNCIKDRIHLLNKYLLSKWILLIESKAFLKKFHILDIKWQYKLLISENNLHI